MLWCERFVLFCCLKTYRRVKSCLRTETFTQENVTFWACLKFRSYVWSLYHTNAAHLQGISAPPEKKGGFYLLFSEEMSWFLWTVIQKAGSYVNMRKDDFLTETSMNLEPLRRNYRNEKHFCWRQMLQSKLQKSWLLWFSLCTNTFSNIWTSLSALFDTWASLWVWICKQK